MSRVDSFLRRVAYSAATVLLVVAHTVVLTVPAHAVGETFSTVANKTVAPNESASLADLQISGVSDDEISLIIRATGGELSIDDSSVDVNSSDDTRLVITGTLANVNAALQTLTFQRDGLATTTITATLGGMLDGHLLVVDPDTGHGYMVVKFVS